MPRRWIKILSSDGFEFYVDYEAACVSNVIKASLSSAGTFTETEEGTFPAGDIPGEILERVCQYMYYKLKYRNTPPDQIPEFHIPHRHALPLLMAANYLDI